MSYVRKAQELEAICKSRQHGVYVPPSGDAARGAVAWWWYKCQVGGRAHACCCPALLSSWLASLATWGLRVVVRPAQAAAPF